MSAQDQIRETIEKNDVVLFMKGTKMMPQCGFSSRVAGVLNYMGVNFADVNVLADAEIRQGIKDFSDWPTIPQLYVKGEFVGGCDIVTEMTLSGELDTLFETKGVTFDKDAANKIREANGQEFFVYDVEVKLLGGKSAAFSIVALQPVREYQQTLEGVRENLYLGFGAALLVLLALLWVGLTWGLRALRRLSQELDQIESGALESLSEEHPRELLRLTGSLNRLLRSEREQRTRYRDSLDDLAHSLKTPLAVLQGVSEDMAQRPEEREQAWVLQSQIERMSQQISYQLQRASLRKSGLVRHQVALQPVLKSLCDTLDKVYRDKRVRTRFDLPEPCYVPIEQGALLEMLGNLLENAYRLCLGEVRVSLRQTIAGIELCVEDDGPGVPVDQRARILQRGERLDRQHPGQGIGLAVVKDIIESYGAQLTLGDSPMGGAAFRIHFPAA